MWPVSFCGREKMGASRNGGLGNGDLFGRWVRCVLVEEREGEFVWERKWR